MLDIAGRQGEAAAALAVQLGCRVMEAPPRGFGYGSPAIVGATDGVATALKKYGGRWSLKKKALLFRSWPILEGVLRAVLAEQGGESRPPPSQGGGA